MGESYRCGRFENVRVREDLDVDKRAIIEGIDGIYVTPGEAEVADARAHAGPHSLGKDFRRSYEGKSGSAAPFLFHTVAFPGSARDSIPNRPLRGLDIAAQRLPCSARTNSRESVTCAENSE
jgi:hypothetical protein